MDSVLVLIIESNTDEKLDSTVHALQSQCVAVNTKVTGVFSDNGGVSGVSELHWIQHGYVIPLVTVDFMRNGVVDLGVSSEELEFVVVLSDITLEDRGHGGVVDVGVEFFEVGVDGEGASVFPELAFHALEALFQFFKVLIYGFLHSDFVVDDEDFFHV